MKSTKSLPTPWLEAAVKQIEGRQGRSSLLPIARKLAEEKSLSPLWRKLQKEFEGDQFWTSPENFFCHLVLAVDLNLRPPSGYHAMTPAQLDSWRKRTQKHAMELLSDLMDGYPQIEEKEDDAFLSDRWVYDAAAQIASNGRLEGLKQLVESTPIESEFSSRFAPAMVAVAKLPSVLTHLITWLDFEAARGHAVTQNSAKTHRNSFIRRMTAFFETHFGSPMRSHVFYITSLFFEMDGLTTTDIKKIAPAREGGKIPVSFLEDFPR